MHVRCNNWQKTGRERLFWDMCYSSAWVSVLSPTNECKMKGVSSSPVHCNLFVSSILLKLSHRTLDWMVFAFVCFVFLFVCVLVFCFLVVLFVVVLLVFVCLFGEGTSVQF